MLTLISFRPAHPGAPLVLRALWRDQSIISITPRGSCFPTENESFQAPKETMYKLFGPLHLLWRDQICVVQWHWGRRVPKDQAPPPFHSGQADRKGVCGCCILGVELGWDRKPAAPQTHQTVHSGDDEIRRLNQIAPAKIAREKVKLQNHLLFPVFGACARWSLSGHLSAERKRAAPQTH